MRKQSTEDKYKWLVRAIAEKCCESESFSDYVIELCKHHGVGRVGKQRWSSNDPMEWGHFESFVSEDYFHDIMEELDSIDQYARERIESSILDRINFDA